jgi:hypothetical protein
MPDSLAAFCNQLIGQGRSWFDMFPDKPLRPGQAAFQRRDPQFIILDAQHDFISYVDPQCFAKGRWYNDATVLIDTQSGFRIDCHDLLSMTLLYLINDNMTFTVEVVSTEKTGRVAGTPCLFR